MKLLLYSHFFAPSIGGTEHVVLSIARGLAQLRSPSGLAEFEITLVTRTPAKDFDDHRFPFQVLRQPSLAQLWRMIRLNDVIHVAGPAISPIALGLVMRKPVVIEHHGFHTICPTGQLLMEHTNAPCPGHFMAGHHLECLRCRHDSDWLASWKLWLLTFARRFLSSRVAANVAPTDWLGDLLSLPRTISIPHGLEPIASAAQSWHPSHPPVIVFQGRLVSTKGIRVLIEAAGILSSRNRSFELLVVGDGPERSGLEELVQKMQLSPFVRFTGHLDSAELESTVAKASVVVVPSLAGEVFGLVVVENMLRGLPIVASDLGAFTEVLGDTGLTFRNGDAHNLAHQLERILDDSTLGPSLGTHARQRVLQNYPRNRMIDAHARLFREICPTNK